MSNRREHFYPFVSSHHFFRLGVLADVSVGMSGVHLTCMPEGTAREGLKTHSAEQLVSKR